MEAKDLLAAYEAAKTAGLIPAPPAVAQTGTGGGFLSLPPVPSDATREREIALRVAEGRMADRQAAAYSDRMSELGSRIGSYALVGGICVVVGALLGLFWRRSS